MAEAEQAGWACRLKGKLFLRVRNTRCVHFHTNRLSGCLRSQTGRQLRRQLHESEQTPQVRLRHQPRLTRASVRLGCKSETPTPPLGFGNLL